MAQGPSPESVSVSVAPKPPARAWSQGIPGPEREAPQFRGVTCGKKAAMIFHSPLIRPVNHTL